MTVSSSARPKLVVLDADPAAGSGLAPEEARGPVDYRVLEEFGEIELFEATPPDLLLERARGATILLTNKVRLERAHFERLPELRLVSVLATGTNVIDVAAARDHGVVVCNVPGYSTASTAQLAIALLLELCHRVGEHSLDVHRGGWSRAGRFAYYRTPLVELEGRTLGVFGLGAIGSRVARIANALGMRVLGTSRSPKGEPDVEMVSLEALLERSDVLSLHAALTPETERVVRAETLARLRPGALVVNVARGPLVDSAAVRAALDDGRLGGYATDVLEIEPPPEDHPLLGAPRCIVTPHIAWATEAARRRLLEATRENIAAFLAGAPRNIVSP